MCRPTAIGKNSALPLNLTAGWAMLFGLGLGGSLLAGFGMAAAKMRSWIHMVVFAATLTVTLYAVTDMEYPRLGLIRIENFDHFLIDATLVVSCKARSQPT